MVKFIGWIAVARKKETHGAWNPVSGPFQMESSAKVFCEMYMKAHPDEDAYVSSKVKREDG